MSNPNHYQSAGYPPINNYDPYRQPPPHSPQPPPHSPLPPPQSPHPPPHSPVDQYPVPQQQVQYNYYPTAYPQEAHYASHAAPVYSHPQVYCVPPPPQPQSPGYPSIYPPPSSYNTPSPGPGVDNSSVYYPPPLPFGPPPHMSPHGLSPLSSPMQGPPYTPGSPQFYNSYGENPYAVPPPSFTWLPTSMPTPYYPPPSPVPSSPSPQPPAATEAAQPTPPPRPSQPPPEVPSRTVEVFYSPLTGLFQSVSGAVSGLMSKLGPGEKKEEAANPVFSDVRTFKCYEIALHHVQEVFGDRKFGWNRKYDAAQRIFGSSMESRTIREGLHLQHSHYYSRDFKLGKGYDKWSVRGGNEFLQKLDYGHYRGYIHYYTYVVTVDGRWRFSRTGKDVMRDLTSKHAMHADCGEEVRYAGEFVIVPRPEGGYHLVIDNNSGTYAPDGKQVSLVAELLRKNFPGLAVAALDREDPHHKQVTEWVAKNNAETTSKRGITF